MSILEKLLIKRLNKIRNDLNLYIELRLLNEVSKNMADTSSKSVMDSFVSAMRITEEYDEDVFCDDETVELEELCSKREMVVPRQERHAPARMPNSPQIHPTTGGFATTNRFTDIEEVLKEKEETFSNMLLRLIDEKGLKDSDVYKRANIDRRLFSKIRGDENYTPSKKTAIAFCLALCLDVDESNELLKTAGYTLSASSRFDLIIAYLIEHKEFNIHFVNMVLDDYGEGTLTK